ANALAREITSLHADITAAQAQGDALRQVISNQHTDDYVVQKARDFGYIGANESLYAVQRNEQRSAGSAASAQAAPSLHERRNAEKARGAMRRWRQRHPDQHAAEGRAYYARNKKRLDLRNSAYNRANPEVVRAKWQNYRARRAAAQGSFTAKQWLELVAQYHRRCAYCGEQAILVVEHRVPLSRGGTNSINNILPACRPCNYRKHRLSDDEFRTRMRQHGRRVRPVLRMALCPKHEKHQNGDEQDGEHA